MVIRLVALLTFLGGVLGCCHAAGMLTLATHEVGISVPGLALYRWRITPGSTLLFAIVAAGVIALSVPRLKAAVQSVARRRPLLPECLMVLFVTVYTLLNAQFDLSFSLLIACLVTAIYFLIASTAVGAGRRAASSRDFLRRHALVILPVGTFLLLAGLGWWLYGGVPYVVDSASELFHARLLERGLFALPEPPSPASFRFANVVVGELGWFSFYPPGHILWLALFDLVGAAWLVNPVMGALLAVVLHRLGREVYTESTAVLAVLLLLISPFFQLMQSGMMSHGGTILYLAAATWLVLRMPRSTRQGRDALCVGLLIGAALITRPLTAAGVVAPLFVYSLAWVLPSVRQKLRATMLTLAGFALPVAVLLLFNAKTTGGMFTMAYQVSGSRFFRLGFGGDFTPAAGLVNSLNNLYAMDDFLLGFPSGSFLFVLALLVAGRLSRIDWLLLAMTASLSVVYIVYGYQDFWYGPRFLYEALPLLLLLSARGLTVLGQAANELLGKPNARIAGIALVTLALLACLSSVRILSPHHRSSRGGQGDLLRDVAPILEDKNAVVFLDDPYDYTLYPFNARFPEGPVFAKRLGIADRELMRALPGRSFYLYSVRHLRPYDADSGEARRELPAEAVE
jgi:hypothetical protein